MYNEDYDIIQGGVFYKYFTVKKSTRDANILFTRIFSVY